jgi:hypothetical protein
MGNNTPKIMFTVYGVHLQALRGICAEFDSCGKVRDILISSHSDKKNLKLNDSDFICVYNGILKALKSNRYLNKKGNEYNAVMELKEMFEQLHIEQRGNELRL